MSIPLDSHFSTLKPKPTAEQPGSLAEQLLAVATSIYLGERRKSDARREWNDARELVLPHARGEATR